MDFLGISTKAVRCGLFTSTVLFYHVFYSHERVCLSVDDFAKLQQMLPKEKSDYVHIYRSLSVDQIVVVAYESSPKLNCRCPFMHDQPR